MRDAQETCFTAEQECPKLSHAINPAKETFLLINLHHAKLVVEN